MAKNFQHKNKQIKNQPAPAKQDTPKKEPDFFEKHKTIISLLIFAIAFALYAQTLNYGYVMDDGAVITDNKTVKKGFSAISQLFKESSVYGSTGENFGTYRPLVMVMFAIEYGIWGAKPFIPHLVNVLLYGLCCVALYKTLRKLLHDYNPLIALGAVLLFIVHPIHTEVVASIKSRDEILCLFLLLTATYKLYDYFQKKSKTDLLLSYLCFFGALFSKESAITFLFVIPLSFYFFTKIPFRTVLQFCIPFVILSLVYLAARDSVLAPITSKMPVINNTLVDAKNAGEKYATILFIMFLYLKNLFLANNLSFDYGYAHVTIKQLSDPVVMITLGLFVWMAAYVIWKFKSKNIFAFIILFYVATLSVSSNVLIMIAATMADRFLFVPSVAYCLAISAAMVMITKAGMMAEKKVVWNKSFIAIMLLLSLGYSGKTIARNPVWESNYTLFESGTISAPNSYRTNRAFAVECLVQYQKETDTTRKAMLLKNMITYYEKAMKVYDKAADDNYNIGVCYYFAKDYATAQKYYIRCIELNPNYLNAAYNAAMIYSNNKEHDNAIKYFLIAYGLNPNFMETSFKLGLHYHYKGDYLNAIKYYEGFYAANPASTDVLTNLVLACNGAGQTDKANYYNAKLQELKGKLK